MTMDDAAREPWLEVEQVPTADLVPYANNSKLHTDDQVAHIAASIERFGMCDPVGAWHNPDTGELEIVTGHGRVLAMQRLGRVECPVIMLDHLTDEERRAYSHINNTTNAETSFDYTVLAADMRELSVIDWAVFGLNGEEVPAAQFDEGSVHEVGVPEDVEERVRPGEVWQLGEHRLMCADSTDAAAMDLLLGGGATQDGIHRPAVRGGHRNQEQGHQRGERQRRAHRGGHQGRHHVHR